MPPGARPDRPGPSDCIELRIARTRRARLLGLALRDPPPFALVLPATRSVHTFGMRFPLDLFWIGRDGRVLRVDRTVPARRLRVCLRAWGVIEVPAQ